MAKNMLMGPVACAVLLAGLSGCSMIYDAARGPQSPDVRNAGVTDAAGNSVVTAYLTRPGSDFAYFHLKAKDKSGASSTETEGGYVDIERVRVTFSDGILTSYERDTRASVTADNTDQKVSVEVASASDKSRIYLDLLGTTAATKTDSATGTVTDTTEPEKVAELISRYGAVYRRVIADITLIGTDSAKKKKEFSGSIPIDLSFEKK